MTLKLASSLNEKEFEELRSAGTARKIVKHDYVCRSGETSEGVFLLVEGRIKYFYSSTLGKDVILEFILPRKLFCIEDTFGQQPHPSDKSVRRFYAQTCEDSTVVIIEPERFINLLEAQPHLALRIIHQLSSRMRLLERRLLNISVDDVVSRVAHTLINLRDDGHIEYELVGGYAISLTQQDIADIVGAARQTVNRALHFLKDRGLIELLPQRIQIKNMKELELISQTTERRGKSRKP